MSSNRPLVASLFMFPTTKSGNVYQTLEKWFPNYTNQLFNVTFKYKKKQMRSLLIICHIKLKQYGFKQAFGCFIVCVSHYKIQIIQTMRPLFAIGEYDTSN